MSIRSIFYGKIHNAECCALNISTDNHRILSGYNYELLFNDFLKILIVLKIFQIAVNSRLLFQFRIQ